MYLGLSQDPTYYHPAEQAHILGHTAQAHLGA